MSPAHVIADRLPPLELRRALDAATTGVSVRELRQAAVRLSEGYRSSTATGRRSVGRWSSVDYLAYAATRMPAIYRAAAAVFRELRARCPELRVESVLDIGAGPATCLWAAWTEFDALVRVMLVEPDPAMVALGKRLTEGTELTQRVETTWQTTDVSGLAAAPAAHDVVVASYVLAELDAAQRRRVVEEAWVGARGAVALVEPGSVQGYQHIMEARDRLLGLGARIVAPCPHGDACPMPVGDWCHFGVRLNRTAMQKRLKGGVLAYEDEKYAYVLATRDAGAPAPSRVIRRPKAAPGQVTLHLCGADGLFQETLTRSRRDAYRMARQARWGDPWR